ncbi:hypothetical protein HanRHA438_Chr05g0213181 [Helianthus annuus]|nr:hypothetical protein HanRHA438_Chr05g0213181 [Helianthus annuus]
MPPARRNARRVKILVILLGERWGQAHRKHTAATTLYLDGNTLGSHIKLSWAESFCGPPKYTNPVAFT